MMKLGREVKIGVLAIVCIFLLIFGFNYLKGVNIFSSVRTYHGKYINVKGLQEQSPVLSKGYKIGLVKAIHYDFTKDTSFIVDISIDKSIKLPHGTQMVLVPNSLLDGTAIELVIPSDTDAPLYTLGDFIPTKYKPSIKEKLEKELLVNIDTIVSRTNVFLRSINSQIAGNHIKSSLHNIDILSEELKHASRELNLMITKKIPPMVNHVDTILENVNVITADIRDADIKQTVGKLKSTIGKVDKLISNVNSKTGTVGLLVNDDNLYKNLNTAVVSVDSLLVDLKENPKRYVHFSLFGKKDKEKKGKGNQNKK